MKRTKTLLCLLLLTLLLACLMLPALAAEYTYTVRLYAGGRGTIRGQSVLVYSGLHYGDRILFPVDEVEVNDGKYYVKGFRESGRDNNTVGAPSFAVTKDQDFVVAYGVRGELVAYTVRYLSNDGTQLAPDTVGYGNVGDKPVVGYRYIEGWRPQAYNLTKTLSANPAENVLVFTYTKTRTPAAAPVQPDAPEESAAPGAASEPAEAPASTPAESTAPVDGDAGGSGGFSGTEPLLAPQELLDLDAPAVRSDADPAANGGVPAWLWIVSAIGCALGLASLTLWLLRRRRKRS